MSLPLYTTPQLQLQHRLWERGPVNGVEFKVLEFYLQLMLLLGHNPYWCLKAFPGAKGGNYFMPPDLACGKTVWLNGAVLARAHTVEAKGNIEWPIGPQAKKWSCPQPMILTNFVEAVLVVKGEKLLRTVNGFERFISDHLHIPIRTVAVAYGATWVNFWSTRRAANDNQESKEEAA